MKSLALLFTLTCAAAAQQFPALEAQTLTDKKLTVPAAWAGKPALLIVGFSQASQRSSESWGKELLQDFGKDFPYYSAAVLEDAPRLLRGVITGGIKRSIPKPGHDRFLVFYKGQKELKQVAGFDPKSPDDAYLVIVDAAGNVKWKFHGKPTPTQVAEIKAAF